MGLRILYILLASILFLSTVGITINKHYCKEQLRSAALWLVPKSCHETKNVDSNLPSCPFHAQKQDKPKCCSDESDYVKSDTQQHITTNDFELVNSTVNTFISIHNFKNQLFTFIESEYALYCFHPPPKQTSRTILYQQFLI